MDGEIFDLDPRSIEYIGIKNGTLTRMPHCYYRKNYIPYFYEVTGSTATFAVEYVIPSGCTGSYIQTWTVKDGAYRHYSTVSGQQLKIFCRADPYTKGNSFAFALRDDRTPSGYKGDMQPADWLRAPEGAGGGADGYNNYMGTAISFNTYGVKCSVNYVESDACVVTFSEQCGEFTLRVGTVGNNYLNTFVLPDVKICYYLKGSDGHTIGTIDNPLQTNPGAVRITGLHPNVTYHLRCHLYGLADKIPLEYESMSHTEKYHPGDGPNLYAYKKTVNNTEVDTLYVHDSEYDVDVPAYDCIDDAYFTTTAQPSEGTNVAEATGTTIKCWPTWSASGADSVNVTVSCDGQIIHPESSGSLCYFTGLTRGATYAININGEASYHVTTTDEEGNTYTLNWTRSWSSITIITTYKISLTLLDRSTQALKFNSSITHGADNAKTIKYKTCLNSKNGTVKAEGNVSGTMVQQHLDHGNTYSLTAWINNMRDENGELDTLEEIITNTKLLTLVNTDHAEHMHTIETSWQAKADGIDYDQDNILGTHITFVANSCYNTPSKLSGVLSNASTKTGNTSGSYKNLLSSGLDHFTVYVITCAITDGYNIVSTTITLQTLFPYCRVYHDGNWYKAMPWVYTENGWVPAPAFIKVSDSEWMGCNPE